MSWGRLETMVSKGPLASKVMQGQRNSLSQNEQRGGPEPLNTWQGLVIAALAPGALMDSTQILH